MTVIQPAAPSRDAQADQVAAELLDRARQLRPVLRERAVATNADRRLPDETVAELKATGLLKVLQAPRNGGYGLGMRAHLDVNAALAEGCGSTAWVVGVVHAHSWLISHFPEPAQDVAYGADPDTFISAVIGPRGRAERTGDGWRLTGVWPFASGSEHADHLILGAMLVDGDEELGPAELLVPRSAVTVRDDWHVTGLAGTGSCTVEVDGVDVPHDHHLPMAALASGQSPGASLHEVGWNHRAAGVPVLILALVGPALGIARRALADFPSVIGRKLIAYTDQVQAEHTTAHLHLAEAATLVDEAHFHLYRAADDIDSRAREGASMDVLTRARIRADCAEAARSCLRAIELLWRDTGGSGLFRTNPVGWALADLQAMNVHGGLMLDSAREVYGRVLLGLEPGSQLL